MTSSGSVIKKEPPSAPLCMIPSTAGSNPARSGDEPEGATNTDKTENRTWN